MRALPVLPALLALAVACRSVPVDPTPPRAGELVVDVHSHAFTALHLPISGFVAAYAGGDTRLGRLVERLVLLQAPEDCEGSPPAGLDELPGEELCESWLELARAASPLAEGGAATVSGTARDALADSGSSDFDRVWRCRVQLATRAARAGTPREADDAELDALLDYALGRLAQAPASLASLPVAAVGGAQALLDPEALREHLDRYVRLVWTLTRSSDAVARRLLATYPAADLSVPHMMDMQPWFPDDDDVCRPLESQIEDMARAMTAPEALGRLHAFLPFDPRREIEQPGRALRLVEQHVGRGFLGVKLYPPMGFRAAGNAEAIEGEGDDPPTPELYDPALRRLYAWCVAEDVPLAAHCNDKGAESAPGRGKRSNPWYWKRVLSRPEFSGLRLDLGHFGGHDLGVPDGWTETIGELMQTYPHVYADFSYTDLPANEKELARWRAFFDRYPRAAERLMFGTDWPMILREPEGHAYLSRARAVFEEHFPELLDGVFGRNALRYLGLDRPTKNRARLVAFYDGVAPGFRPARWWPFVAGQKE